MTILQICQGTRVLCHVKPTEPTRMQEIHCISLGIPLILPIMYCFDCVGPCIYMTWYKMQSFLMIHHTILSNLSLKACLSVKKIHVTHGMFHTTQKHCITSMYVSLSVMPHFAQNVERSVTTLAKDPHGDVDEPQFIDASKLVSKHTLNIDYKLITHGSSPQW